jgi:hypothetical protein
MIAARLMEEKRILLDGLCEKFGTLSLIEVVELMLPNAEGWHLIYTADSA